MDRVIRLVASQGFEGGTGGDTFTDRLSYHYTVAVLGTVSLFMTTMQWLGENPISCYCPASFTKSHEEFTNKVNFATKKLQSQFQVNILRSVPTGVCQTHTRLTRPKTCARFLFGFK